MRRIWIATLATIAVLLGAFALVEAAGVGWLRDPGGWLAGGGVAAAAGGVGLLVADVALPVPSSLVMLAHGALFGVATGTALSLAGIVGGTMVAHEIGRRGRRLFDEDTLARAGRLLERHGVVAVLATRPVPILAETTALASGAAAMPRSRVAVAAVIGGLPPAAIYGLAGAGAADLDGFHVLAGVLGLAALAWLATRGRRATVAPAS